MRLLLCMIFLLTVACTDGAKTFLIPEGYVGPVVVAFGEEGGEVSVPDAEGGEIYRIPPDGVLRVSTPFAGGDELRFFDVDASATRTPIRYKLDDQTALQVFLFTTGSTQETDGAQRVWQAFVVGVPKERPDWLQVRDDAEFRAVGASMFPPAVRQRWLEEQKQQTDAS